MARDQGGKTYDHLFENVVKQDFSSINSGVTVYI